MYSGRDLAAASGFGAAQGIVTKVMAVGAFVALMVVVMIAPFGARSDQVSAACPPGGPGFANDPRPRGQLRMVQIAYAKVIDGVAVSRGLPGQATLVALMTALQESQLQNLTYGDRDSLGLFQQRPAAGWGTREEILDPVYAANAFFGGDQKPDPPGLVDINNWDSMPYTVAAQAVQVSAFPNAYARHEDTARDIAEEADIDLDRPGDPYAGRSSAHPRPVGTSPSAATDPQCGGGVISGRPIAGHWPPEQQSVPDPTGTGGMLTPRTAAWVGKAKIALGDLSMSCWDAHLWNPTSDHPKGKACDIMVGGDARQAPAKRARGDEIANWTIQTAETTGVRYVIWYGKIWSARTGAWRPYGGGGIYNPRDATGGHYDHVHVSMY